MSAWRTPGCEIWCGGHVDLSTLDTHSVALGTLLGDYVTVTRIGDAAPVVALADLTHPQHDMTPDEARLLAAHLWRGAGLADRYGFPLMADEVEHALWALLAAREIPIP